MAAEKKAKSAKQLIVQDALQTTWLLKGHLKNAQISYIRVGMGLAKIRDHKLYEALGHPDMVDYAAKRLNLGMASLYRYLRVHDWILEHHKEWLEPRPKGFIPDLADVADLIIIETELTRGGLSPGRRSALDNLKQKALEGSLRKGELGRLIRRGNTEDDGLKAFLAKLRNLRMRGSQLKAMPPKVISDMDSAIGTLKDVIATQKMAALFGPEKPEKFLTA